MADQGDTQKSLDYLEQAAHLQPDYLPIYLQESLLHLDAGDTEKAANAITKAQMHQPDNPEVRMATARLELQRGNPQAACELLEQLQANGWRHPYLHQLLGTAYQRTGRTAEASLELAKATGDKLFFNDPWQNAMLSLKRGFETQYTKALKQISEGHTREGIALLESLSQQGTQDVEVANALAAAYANDGRIDQAIEILRASARSHPKAEATHVNLSIMYAKKGQFEPALNHANYAVKLAPHLPAAYLQNARMLLKTGQSDEALEALDQAFSLGATQNKDRIMYGQVLLQSNRYEEARQQMKAATGADPESALAWAGLALAEANLGRRQLALDHLKRAQTLDPENVFVGQVQRILSRNQ